MIFRKRHFLQKMTIKHDKNEKKHGKLTDFHLTDFIICQKERWLLIGLKWENMHFELTFGGGKV